MRIAIATEGSRGDVHPMLALGQAFERIGHEVVVCGPPDAADDVARFGFAFRPVGMDVRAYLSRHADAIRVGGTKMARASLGYLAEAAVLQFQQLPDAVSDADLVVGAGVQLAAHSAAELHGTPYRYVIYCPAFLPTPEHPPLFVRGQRYPRWCNRMLWGALHAALVPMMGRFVARQRAVLGLPAVRDGLRHLVSDHPVVASDPELGALWPDDRYGAVQAGYLHPEHPDEVPAKVLAFLEAGPRPVYVGFGSMADPDPAGTTRLVLEAVERAGCRVLLSRGWAGFGEGPLPEHIHLLDAVPHSKLFPRLRGAVHHGGAGTTATAARAGIPQLVVPHLLDQFYWGEGVHRRGLGPAPVSRTRLTAERLAAGLRELLENEWLGERAAAVGCALRGRDARQEVARAILDSL